jgi:hypothetical protein
MQEGVSCFEGFDWPPFNCRVARGADLTNPKAMKAGIWPGFTECRVFSAGMKIVIDKNLENLEGFLTRFYELYANLRHLESYYCILR